MITYLKNMVGFFVFMFVMQEFQIVVANVSFEINQTDERCIQIMIEEGEVILSDKSLTPFRQNPITPDTQHVVFPKKTVSFVQTQNLTRPCERGWAFWQKKKSLEEI